MKPNAEQLNDVLSAAETATEQQCDDWLRLLLTGDDGSCEGNLDRTMEAVRGWFNPLSQDQLHDMLKMCPSWYTTTSRTLWERLPSIDKDARQ